MKTIGILGGLGPQATMDFEVCIHRVSQRFIPPQANSGYPPMIVFYHRRPPVLVEANGMPLFPLQPDPQLLEFAKQLGALADFIVITANGPHTLQAQIEEAAGIEVLSMIAVTLAEVQRLGWQKIGVLGLGKPAVYLDPLAQMGLPTEILPEEHQSRLNVEIFKLMAGQEDAGSTDITLEMVNVLRAKGVDGIILGCTELPLLLGAHAEALDLVNPAALLAEAAVRYAIS